MDFRWNELKDRRLKMTRGVSFEDILNARFIRVIDHPTIQGQYLMLFEHNGYVWVVPFVREERGIFLKTLYPCRKYMKLYKKGRL